MPGILYRKISKKVRTILLAAVLVEVLVLAFVVIGIRKDFNRNFSILSEKLGSRGRPIEEFRN